MMEYISLVRNFCENVWASIFQVFGNNEKWIFMGGSSMVLFFSFCFINGVFMYLDLRAKPKFLLKYKIQKDKNVPVDLQRYINCAKVSLTNELLTCCLVCAMYPFMKSWGMSCQSNLPPVWKILLDFFVFLVVAEFIFYYSHRLLHHPLFYKRIHKKHHEWIAPISIAASYAHPLEHIVSNALPLLVGPILMGAHLSEAWVWFMMSQIETCLHHSDYHLPILSSPQFHDYHHVKFTENFGITGWLDNFHSTNINYKKSIQAKRHVTFYDVKPITEKFPSENMKEN